MPNHRKAINTAAAAQRENAERVKSVLVIKMAYFFDTL